MCKSTEVSVGRIASPTSFWLAGAASPCNLNGGCVLASILLFLRHILGFSFEKAKLGKKNRKKGLIVRIIYKSCFWCKIEHSFGWFELVLSLTLTIFWSILKGFPVFFIYYDCAVFSQNVTWIQKFSDVLFRV